LTSLTTLCKILQNQKLSQYSCLLSWSLGSSVSQEPSVHLVVSWENKGHLCTLKFRDFSFFKGEYCIVHSKEFCHATSTHAYNVLWSCSPHYSFLSPFFPPPFPYPLYLPRNPAFIFMTLIVLFCSS
jgi:hypothetical protein